MGEPLAPQTGSWRRWAGALVIAACVIATVVAWLGQPLTVVLIRHAEKAAQPPDDPPLTDAGTARAQALLDVLGDAGVDAIFVSSLIRTGLTAAPLASAEGLTPVIVPIVEQDPQPYVTDLLDRLRSGHWGDTVLVVSHSHTLAMIAQQLGAPATGDIGNEFDNLFTITVPRWWGTPTIARARYGAAN